MDIERLLNRARGIVILLSLLGIIIAAGGIVMAFLVIDSLMKTHGNGASIIDTLAPVAPLGMIAVTGIFLAAIPWLVWPIITVSVRRAMDERYRHDQLVGTVESQRQLIESLRDAALLSDAAKQIAFRHKDKDVLRTAIREEMEKNDWESAMALVDEMDRRFGYKAESQQLRVQIEATQKKAIDAKLKEASAAIDTMVSRLEWAGAQREADRIARQLPTNLEARRLPERIQAAKDAHKRELLKQWNDAAGRDDVDRSVELLRQLDQYLTPSEAEAYKESARDVFKKKLQQLGVQFALHVHDRNWTEAFRIGKQINDEFPNSRIAAEVRERMEVLQRNAQVPAAASPAQPATAGV
jgi:hypothetical protein